MTVQLDPAPQLDWAAPFDSLVVGHRFSTRARTVTEADVVGFAGLTGDYHPHHTDAEWARDHGFGQRIAHGMLIVSFAVGLLPFDPDRVLALRRIGEVVFKRPVLLGDTIHAGGEIAHLSEIDERAGLVAFRYSIINQHGKLACRGLVEVLWRTDTA